MAPEKSAKRKSASPATPASKKPKKAGHAEAAVPKISSVKKKTETVVDNSESVVPKAVSNKAPRKRAADYFDEPEPKDYSQSSDSEASTPAKKARKAKATNGEVKKYDAPEIGAPATAKKTKKIEGAQEPPDEEPNAGEEVADGTESEDEDDQTSALLKGFESSEDEKDPEDEGIAIDKLPELPKDGKLRTKLDNASRSEQDGPGVIYVGRIPHGFYEQQMRAYFSQFGDVTRLRLSRNKKTGKSKHYAFVEFASAEVADIVAKTMNGYLMFNHILQVKTIPQEQVHPDLFKHANRRFKPMPRNKIEGRKLRLPVEREAWDKRIERETHRRSKKAKKLKEMGYKYEMPTLRSTKEVPRKDGAATEAAQEPEEAAKALQGKAHNEDGDVEGVIRTAQRDSQNATVPEKTKIKKPKKTKQEGGPVRRLKKANSVAA